MRDGDLQGTRPPFGSSLRGVVFATLLGAVGAGCSIKKMTVNKLGDALAAGGTTFASDDAGSGTNTEVRAAFEGHASYFGTYTIDPSARTVTHHVRGASYPNWVGHKQVRYYRIDGVHLVLSTPPIPYRGESLGFVLTWERT